AQIELNQARDLSVCANLIYLIFRTPLHLACANGHVDVVTYLVENKCKLNLFDNDNRSPLMKAVQCQQEKCVAILLKHGDDPNLADADGNTALHLAVLSANTAVTGLLLEHNASIDAQNKEGYTPLLLAVSEHHEEIVEFLLKNGAEVHARDQLQEGTVCDGPSGRKRALSSAALPQLEKPSPAWQHSLYVSVVYVEALSEDWTFDCFDYLSCFIVALNENCFFFLSF
uniref:Ankyrin repeat domain-containing protein 7 n=1 Tax=Otus sunia TaxID=257818 RepID=A0A8C8BKM5_9STRI